MIRTVAIFAVLLLPGCIDFGMCGPTLMHVELKADLLVGWTEENQTLAREGLTNEGFTANDPTPWGSTFSNGNDWVSLSAENNKTHLVIRRDLANEEFDSHQHALDSANIHREILNQTLAQFLDYTGFQVTAEPSFEPSVAVC